MKVLCVGGPAHGRVLDAAPGRRIVIYPVSRVGATAYWHDDPLPPLLAEMPVTYHPQEWALFGRIIVLWVNGIPTDDELAEIVLSPAAQLVSRESRE